MILFRGYDSDPSISCLFLWPMCLVFVLMKASKFGGKYEMPEVVPSLTGWI